MRLSSARPNHNPSSPAERSEGKGIQTPTDRALGLLDPLPSAPMLTLWASPGVTG